MKKLSSKVVLFAVCFICVHGSCVLRASENVVGSASLAIADDCYFGNNVTPDYQKAYAIYLKEAHRNNSVAQKRLGDYFYEGRAGPPNYELAFDWYYKSALNNNTEAQVRVAELYGNGDGVLQDTTKAVEWLLKAANNGSTEAKFLLGVIYNEGEGGAQDLIVSYMWFSLAAEAGNIYADRTRDYMEKNLLTRAQLKKAIELLDNYQKNGIFANN
ncbi:MAG: tetratricopeptide repeat protein [Candidatus Riflebacteria bacterium]|nr:tetratricopeptide repeat protein [Candidatus Riflebacteria bacterium]